VAFIQAHTTFVPNSTNAKASSAAHTGSLFKVSAKASQLPYLCIIACLHSGVAISLYIHFILSYGLVLPLIVAVNVFNALAGILPNN
jgi:hypothetical protein